MSTQTFTTGTTVLAIEYNGGTLLASDMALSYGKQHLTNEFSRIVSIGNTAIAFSGDQAHFRYTVQLIERAERENERLGRGALTAHEIHRIVTEQHYEGRNDQEPCLNSILVASRGFLRSVDVFGTWFEHKVFATSIGAYYALPFLREQYNENMTREQARDVACRALSILLQNDCLASEKVELCFLEEEVVREELSVAQPWDVAAYRDLSVVMKQ